MRIGIIGAGIAGLSAAIGLDQRGHEVTVFERSFAPATTGAGLTLFGNSFEAFDFLGIGDEIRAISTDCMTSMTLGQRRPDGSWLTKAPAAAYTSMRTVHRRDLHERLTELLGSDRIRYGVDARVAADGSPSINTSGETVEVDLVIVADGIHSRNRARLGLDPGLHYSGYTAWRGVTHQPVDLQGCAGEALGRGQIFGCIPLPHDAVYWFATLTTPAGGRNEDEKAALLSLFQGWHSPVSECIEATRAEDILRHDIHDLARPLRRYTRGSTALMGDAAHAMTPNLAQGAGQGIEDAATLVLCLGEAEGTVEAALARYSQLRTRRANPIMRRSRTAGRLFQMGHPAFAAARNTLLKASPDRALLQVSKALHHWPQPR